MTNEKLVKYIFEARRRGYSDSAIKEPLLKKGWFDNEIHDAFAEADKISWKTEESEKAKTRQTSFKGKKKFCIFIDEELYRMLEKRAKKNYFSIEALVDDIVRRSMVSYKGAGSAGRKIKCDDLLVDIFSREKKGRKRKRNL